MAGSRLRKIPVTIAVMSVTLCCIFSCHRDNYHDIDYSRTAVINQMSPASKTIESSLTLAVASIISAQESFLNYQALADYLQSRCGRKVSVTFPKTYQDVYDLFKQKRIDMGFICSGLFVLGRREKIFELLVSPVVNGKTTYQAYIITTGNSQANSLSGIIGKPFAFTDKLSLTGYYYPVFSAKDYAQKWGETIFTGSHDQSIDLVNRGVVEGGCVSGLVYDDLARRYPERVRNTRIIEKSIEFGNPPVVIAPSMDREVRECLRKAFTEMHLSKDGKSVLKALGIDRFGPGYEEQYDCIEKMVPRSRP
jgi:phosphonate transport system substrate-binding protein